MTDVLELTPGEIVERELHYHPICKLTHTYIVLSEKCFQSLIKNEYPISSIGYINYGRSGISSCSTDSVKVTHLLQGGDRQKPSAAYDVWSIMRMGGWR